MGICVLILSLSLEYNRQHTAVPLAVGERPAADTVYAESAEVSAYSADEELHYGLLAPSDEELNDSEREASAGTDDVNFNLIQFRNKSECFGFDKNVADWIVARFKILSAMRRSCRFESSK